MSNGNGISFVHDLVAMATAADKVPQLEDRIRLLEQISEEKSNALNDLNKRLLDVSNAHSETKAELLNAEVARDDAEFRFLEADDAKLVAVHTMRTVITEAEAFIKAVTPQEPAPAKPDYSGKWLTDVQGWMGISINDWLANGGSSDRFERMRPPEPVEASPNVPNGSTSSFEEMIGATQVEVKASEGEGQREVNPIPVSGSAHILAGLETERREQAIEDPCAPNPTADTSLGSIGEIVHSGSADGTKDASTEGDKDSPFASTTITESQTVSSHGVELREDAHTSGGKDDLWAIPSRASHYS